MKKTFFGECPAGKVELITLTDGQGMEARIMTMGATLQSLFVTNPAGEQLDVILGCDTVEEYLKNCNYFGATVGRVANRIARGQFSLGEKTYQVPCNNGRNALHGGPDGFSWRIFTPVEYSPARVGFRLTSPDGDMGFPGKLDFEVIYSLETPGTLSLEYRAVSDKDTLISPTNHSYFNVGGHDSGSVDGQSIRLESLAWTPTDAELIPTGELRKTAGTALDMEKPRLLGEINGQPEFAAFLGLDTNFCLKEEVRDGKKPAGCVASKKSGLAVEFRTEMPGVQLYGCGGMKLPGKRGAVYGDHQAICLETQVYPDAVNQPGFPSMLLKAGEQYVSRTSYSFRAAKPGDLA